MKRILPFIFIFFGLIGLVSICIYMFTGDTVQEEFTIVNMNEKYTLLENENKSMMYINTLPYSKINDTIIITTRFSYFYPEGEVSIVNAKHIYN